MKSALPRSTAPFEGRTQRALLVATPPTLARLGTTRVELDQRAAAAFPSCSLVAASHPHALHGEIRRYDPDVIIAAGGDGTVNLALQAMREHDALALLPLGTANDLARCLGVSRNPGFLGSFVLRSSATIDVLHVNGQRFCTTGGLGLPAEIAHRVNVLRDQGQHDWLESLGASLYPVIAAQCCLASPPLHALELEWEDALDGRVRRASLDTHGLFVTNQSTFARSMSLVRDADNGDGVFELCILLPRGCGGLLRLLGAAMQRRAIASSELRIIRARAARITCDRDLRFQGDGEVLDKASVFELGIAPAALRLLS